MCVALGNAATQTISAVSGSLWRKKFKTWFVVLGLVSAPRNGVQWERAFLNFCFGTFSLSLGSWHLHASKTVRGNSHTSFYRWGNEVAKLPYLCNSYNHGSWLDRLFTFVSLPLLNSGASLSVAGWKHSQFYGFSALSVSSSVCKPHMPSQFNNEKCLLPCIDKHFHLHSKLQLLPLPQPRLGGLSIHMSHLTVLPVLPSIWGWQPLQLLLFQRRGEVASLGQGHTGSRWSPVASTSDAGLQPGAVLLSICFSDDHRVTASNLIHPRVGTLLHPSNEVQVTFIAK